MGGLEEGIILESATAPEVTRMFFVKRHLIEDDGSFPGMPMFVTDVEVLELGNKQMKRDGWMQVRVVSKDLDFMPEGNIIRLRNEIWDRYDL